MKLKLVHCYDDRLSPIMWFYFVLYIYIHVALYIIPFRIMIEHIRSDHIILYDLFLS